MRRAEAYKVIVVMEMFILKKRIGGGDRLMGMK